MYKVFIWEAGEWVEMGNSDDFGNAWAYARSFKGRKVRLVGAETDKVWEKMA